MKNKKELIFIGGILLIATALLLFFQLGKESGNTAHILVNNQEVTTLSLDENTTYSPPGLPNVTLQVEDHQIRFEESDCKDQLCVHQGNISSTHEKIVCLPNQVVITISGEKSELDGVIK